MPKITSNSAVAKQIATAIAHSLDSTTHGNAILSDTQTTIAGNTHAQEAIQLMSHAQRKIGQAIGRASTNLQSVANEFEAADQATKQLMTNISLPASIGGKQ